MDGTLLGPDGRVSARVRASLAAAEQAGVEVAIATGRRHTYAMRQAVTFGLGSGAVVVSSNGAVVRTMGSRLLRRAELGLGACERLFAGLGEFRDALVVTFDCVSETGEDQRGALVVEGLDPVHASIRSWVEANSLWMERVVPVERCLERGAPIQAMLCGTVERMRRAEQLLHGIPGVAAMDDAAPGRDLGPGVEIALHRTEYPEKDFSIVDILPAGVSKGSALEELARERGVGMDEVMAVGDNWNDLPMLHVAGMPVLMGNAPEELIRMAREWGWWMAPGHAEDGAATAVEAMLERNARLVQEPAMAGVR